MHIVTQWLSPDEPCVALWEGPEVAPIPGAPNGATDWRWVQKVFVVRADTISKHIIDLGAADEYADSTPFACWSGQQDSVAACQAMAEKSRHDHYWAKRREELIQSSTLITDIIEQGEIEWEWMNNRSVLGPTVNVERNAIPMQAVRRGIKDRRQEKTGRIIHGYGS